MRFFLLFLLCFACTNENKLTQACAAPNGCEVKPVDASPATAPATVSAPGASLSIKDEKTLYEECMASVAGRSGSVCACTCNSNGKRICAPCINKSRGKLPEAFLGLRDE